MSRAILESANIVSFSPIIQSIYILLFFFNENVMWSRANFDADDWLIGGQIIEGNAH